MNFNNLERLNKVLKSKIEDFEESSKMKELKNKLSNKEDDLKEAIREHDKDSIKILNEIIEEIRTEIEEERINPTEEEHFKSYEYIRDRFIRETKNKILKNDEQYKELSEKWYEYYDMYVNDYGERFKNIADDIRNKMKYLELNADVEAERKYLTMCKTGEFKEYYLDKSGKREYEIKLNKMNNIKKIQSKLDNIIEDYSTQHATLTTEDFKTYLDLWNEYIDEPLTIDLKPMNAKYNGRDIEIYKYNVEDSIHKDRIICKDMTGKSIDRRNVYIKYLPVEQEQEPFDIMIYKNTVKYIVYKTSVEGSEFKSRISGLSTETGKTRDYKNKYLKRID